jgi:hypothetical protein
MSKRDRYNNANIRGGMGVRKRLSDESLRDSYRLNGVQTGSVVVRAHDQYRGDFTLGFDIGTLVRKTASSVYIHWLGEDEHTLYDQGAARYEVDRGRWKFLGVIQGNPLDPFNPVVEQLNELRRRASQQLTGDQGHGRMIMSPHAGDTTEEPTEEENEMSKASDEREAAKKALANGDLKDRDTYTAKQVATRCGTDAKTMRKFFRSSASTVEPVGQGGRYEFDAKDMPKIKKEFDTWRKKSEARSTKPTPPAKLERQQIVKAAQDTIDENPDDEFTLEQVAAAIERAQDEEPSEEDLAELEGLDLDLDDLDAQDID